MRPTLLAFLLLVLLAAPSSALVSQDNATPESEFHLLQWRPTTSHAWEDVGNPQPLDDVTHRDVVGIFRGVDWDLTGTVLNFGEWRATALRYGEESIPSNVRDLGLPEPPAAPSMLAAIATLTFLARRSRQWPETKSESREL